MHDEIEPGWRKSSRSSGGNCVEVRETDDEVLVRDSKDREGPVLHFDREAWRAFIEDLKAGDIFAD
ncbi:DUF397 domain-containing protein [Actinoplanes sp. KI2]|uniref:DUF397 domain-containing protein n=1 Tax=Actinoplanes sp. KI2 TaxID=2983315 RepID=UPI0021D5D923|nr:DUF397 domain-containing protein [Actinoplanes sp. KI2]MCU7727781.1 DUF397 domain-containing protein [Actinoplanes sp. KI2]